MGGGSNVVGQPSCDSWGEGPNTVSQPSRDGWGGGARGINASWNSNINNVAIRKEDVSGWGSLYSVTKPVLGSPDAFLGDSLSSITKSPHVMSNDPNKHFTDQTRRQNVEPVICPKSLHSSFYLPSTKNELEQIAVQMVPFLIRKTGHDGILHDPFKIF